MRFYCGIGATPGLWAIVPGVYFMSIDGYSDYSLSLWVLRWRGVIGVRMG